MGEWLRILNPTHMDTATQFRRRKALCILAFSALYVFAQLFMIVRGHFVSSKHFGFWMFPESTYFKASLSRVLTDGKEVKTKRGVWSVQGESGKVRYKWQDFVNGYRMDELEIRQRSKGTFDDTVKYFQHALNYVAQRTPADKVTQQLVMRIEYKRAGGPKEVLVLKSNPRLGGRHNDAS